MANKKNEIEILINATDNASEVLKQTSKSVTELSKNTTSLSKIREENKGKITAAAGVVFAGISYYIKQGIDDINQYNYSVKRLETLTKNSTGATKEQVDALVQQAESLEKVGVAAKDNIVAGMSQFATFDMSTEAISKLTNAYVDYVVAEKGVNATTEEYLSMANGLAQALQGNYQSLTRSGFILDEETKSLIENGNEMERVSAIVDVLNSTYKDFNKTAAETAEGRMILLQRSFNDIRETIAQGFLPILETITEKIAIVVNVISEWTQEHPKLVASILGIIAALTGLITVIGSASLALPTITTAISLLSGPIGIVIATLTALGVAYTTNFGGFRDFVNETWQLLEPVLIELKDAFIEAFGEIWESIKEVYKELEPILIPIRNIFKEEVKYTLLFVVEVVKSSFKSITDSVRGLTAIFSEITSFLNNVFTGNRKGALENLQNITAVWLDTLINIFADFGIDLPAIFETLKTTITNIWDNLFSGLKNICSSAVDWISSKVQKVRDKINSAREAISSLWGGGSSGGRASGGQVIAGQTYRVNEIHGEYFTPAVNGIVTPAKSLNQAPNVNINFGDVTVRDESDMLQIGEIIEEKLKSIYSNIYLHNY